MNLPTISSYGEYDSNNYGAHTLKVDFNSFALYYSYQTIVAFREMGRTYVSENVWGTTTGKHLNWICLDHSKRLPHDEFLSKLNEMLERNLK